MRENGSLKTQKSFCLIYPSKMRENRHRVLEVANATPFAYFWGRQIEIGFCVASCSYICRDCRLKYNFNFEDMSVAFSDSPTFCDHYDTFFIQIRSVEAELQAREDL